MICYGHEQSFIGDKRPILWYKIGRRNSPLHVKALIERQKMSLLQVKSERSFSLREMLPARVVRLIFRYCLPFAMVAGASGATYLLSLLSYERPTLFLFFITIVIVAWYAGAGPGWLTVVLSIVAANYFLTFPDLTLDPDFTVDPNFTVAIDIRHIPWLVAFVVCATATNAVSLKRRRMEAMLVQARDELEVRVRERTLDLQQANERLTEETAERIRAEAALRDAHNELARAARIMTVGELTASIAHEVNQPLAAVIANSEAALNWLKRSPPALTEVKESIGAAITAGERAAAVITRIRRLLTKDPPVVATIYMNKLVPNVLVLVQASLAKRDIAVTCDLEPELPMIHGDRVQLQQLVLGLINNAADAMADVSDRKRELIIRTASNGAYSIKVTIEDTGRGFAESDVTKLFQAFYSTKPNGMGMGLSICRTIVESHGGTIQAIPRSPHGAIFQVDLPVGSEL
jgi:signal transduction histidine kinase